MAHNTPATLIFGLIALAPIVPQPVAHADRPERVDYGREVRPILARSCYACHGPEKRKSGLRLDRKAEALAGGDLGPAIVPGKPDESELIARVVGEDPTIAMPPKGDRLAPEEVQLLRNWIAQGADWPDDAGTSGANGQIQSDHWAFQPLSRPDLPAVRQASWPRNAIDWFLLARLETEGIDPSPEADRATLIRRLSLDLLGLPPAPDEIADFLSDERPDAYEHLVDRLLASPHFGERWGRHWLDLARYADSDGYEKDSARPFAYRYRDWVIDALNRDLPFDQFTTEQLAGDLLPDANLSQKTATGFHRNTLTNTEGGVDPEEFRVKAVLDRANTTGTVWLGLTVGCAQCHSHKYDPITQREYYGLFAFFNTGQEVNLEAPLPGGQQAYERARAAHEAAHRRLVEAQEDDDRNQRPSRQAEWERDPVTLVPTEEIPPAIVTILARPTAERSPDEAEQLAAYHRTIDPRSRTLAAIVTKHAKAAPKAPRLAGADDR